MSASVVEGLGLQLVALLLMLEVVRSRWFMHIGAIFLTMAVLYHGVSELLVLAFPNQDYDRIFVSQPFLDHWVLLVSVALFLFSAGYWLRYRARPPKAHRFRKIDEPIPWHVVLIACLPAYLFSAVLAGIFMLHACGGRHISGPTHHHWSRHQP